jgi:hypothetical protein
VIETVASVQAHARSAGACPGAAGLVSSKTSLRDLVCINTAPSAVAERRVKRLKRSVWASGHLHGMSKPGFRPDTCWFVTLTYDTRGTLGNGAHDWQPDHISDTLQRFRNYCKSHGIPCRYTWVAELQQRGTVHYHLLVWLPVGHQMPKWDTSYRLASGAVRPALWGKGMTNTQKSTAGVGYLMKYLSKLGELTRFPKGLRLYGIGGLNQESRAVRAWYNLPTWAKAEYGVGELVRKAGSLVERATGVVLEPAYNVIKSGGGLLLQQLRPVQPRWFDGAYSALPT